MKKNSNNTWVFTFQLNDHVYTRLNMIFAIYMEFPFLNNNRNLVKNVTV